jgi:hypothetical protein
MVAEVNPSTICARVVVVETNRSENIPSQSWRKFVSKNGVGNVRTRKTNDNFFWCSKVAQSIQLEFVDSLVNFDYLATLMTSDHLF